MSRKPATLAAFLGPFTTDAKVLGYLDGNAKQHAEMWRSEEEFRACTRLRLYTPPDQWNPANLIDFLECICVDESSRKVFIEAVAEVPRKSSFDAIAPFTPPPQEPLPKGLNYSPILLGGVSWRVTQKLGNLDILSRRILETSLRPSRSATFKVRRAIPSLLAILGFRAGAPLSKVAATASALISTQEQRLIALRASADTPDTQAALLVAEQLLDALRTIALLSHRPRRPGYGPASRSNARVLRLDRIVRAGWPSASRRSRARLIHSLLDRYGLLPTTGTAFVPSAIGPAAIEKQLA